MTMSGNQKSQTADNSELIAFCLGLSTNLLIDMLQQAGLDFKRDVVTLRRRTHAEGLGFLTKTLPSLGKDIVHALRGGRLTAPQFSCVCGTAIPHFLKGLLSRIFHSDGTVRDNADVCAITDCYQFCMIFYKLEVPYDPKIQGKILSKFAKVDASLPDDFSHLGDVDTRLEPNVLAVAKQLVTDIVSGLDPQDITPRHGPGAVATGEKPHQKMHFKRIYDSVEEVYPAHQHYFLDERHLFDLWDEQYWSLDHIAEPVAKVVLVPKDSRGPRLISAEPLELQFLQQGLGRKLVQRIERHPFTRGHVNFRDQSVNRNLALLGSVAGEWSTLDLKDASDRVSLALVKELFGGTGLLPSLLALRSKSTILPDGKVVRMRKYAPMGSALCFPVEALCFWALAVACIHIGGGVALRRAIKSVYVYGDDIIVRRGDESHIFEFFPFFALRVNKDKCCFTGLFRESCGCDAYRGQIVTPIKVKRLPLQKRGSINCKRRNTAKNGGFPRATPPIDGAAYASWVSICNLLFQKCYYRAADYVKKHIERLTGPVPVSERNPHRKNVNPWEANTDRHQRDPEMDQEPIVISDSAPCWYVRQVAANDDELAQIRSLVPLRFVRYNRKYQRNELNALVVMPITYKSVKFRKRKKAYLPTLSSTVPAFNSGEGFSDWSELYRHFIADLGTKPYQYAFLRRVKLTRRWTSLAY